MLAPEKKAMFESRGHRVIYARVFVHDEGEKIHGLDENGEPIVRPVVDCNGNPITPTVLLPAKAIGKFYAGDDVESVKAKMQAKTPDLERVKEDGIVQAIDGPVSRVRTLVDRLPR